MVGFTLSMPNVGSWNGKWTGESNLYYRYRKLSKATEAELDGKSFHYNFGDGWSANVSCKKIDAKTNVKLKRRSNGFAGYDWMIDSILNHGEILNSLQRKEKEAPKELVETA